MSPPLIAYSNITDQCIIYTDDAYLTKAMKPVYEEVRQVKSKSKSQPLPKLRLELLERRIAAVGGVWRKVHDSIDKAFDALFELWKTTMVIRIGESFDTVHGNFMMLCEDTETKDEHQKAMEEALREKLKQNVREVKKMLGKDGEIAKLVEECKAYHASGNAGASQLFVQ